MGITHFEHCVESLRQKLMCLPNDGLVFFDWSPHFSGPMPRFQSQHICMNWERINAWAAARRVSLFDTKAVVHPQYGNILYEDNVWSLTWYQGPHFRIAPRKHGKSLNTEEVISQDEATLVKDSNATYGHLLQQGIRSDLHPMMNSSFGHNSWRDSLEGIAVVTHSQCIAESGICVCSVGENSPR